jgi:hypothetical protein
MTAARRSPEGVPLRYLQPGHDADLVTASGNSSRGNDYGDDDPWRLPDLQQAEMERQPLQTPAPASSSRSSQRLRKAAPKRDDDPPPWTPGVWARLPRSGLVALAGSLLRMSFRFHRH